MLLQGILGAPLVALGVPVIGVANLLTFVALVGSAFFAYLLAYRLTNHRGAALVAGLVFAFSPYRRVHLQHLELQWAQWMPLAFWAWHRLLDTGRMRDGLLCAAAILLQLLSSIYYAVFLAVGLAVVGTITLVARRGRIAAPAVLGLVSGAVIVVGVAAIYGQPYAYVRTLVGDRSLEETTRYSATPRSFVTIPADNVVYRHVLPHDGEGETELFPGVTPVVLAGAALIPPATAAAAAYAAVARRLGGHGARGRMAWPIHTCASASTRSRRCGPRRASPSSCSSPSASSRRSAWPASRAASRASARCW